MTLKRLTHDQLILLRTEAFRLAMQPHNDGFMPPKDELIKDMNFFERAILAGSAELMDTYVTPAAEPAKATTVLTVIK